MKKLVNNKVTEIRNIGIFERAFEGLADGRHAVSKVINTISDDREVVELANLVISVYNLMYKSIPFPLYAAEVDLKYVALANFLKDHVDEPLTLWVDAGLYVKLGNDRAIKFVANTWSIETIEKEEEDNTYFDNYRDEDGYKEYLWVCNQMIKGESLKDYYKIFMREFTEACSSSSMVMKWELTRMLEMGSVPTQLKLKDNIIIDLGKKSEIIMDIYSTGKVQTEEPQFIFRLDGNIPTMRQEKKNVMVHDYDLLEKKIRSNTTDSDEISKLKKVDIDGMLHMFETIVGKGLLQNSNNSIFYKGFIANEQLVYQVGNNIYICNSNKYDEVKNIAVNSDIFGYEYPFIYLTKSSRCDSGVIRDVIYAYNYTDKTVRVCKIDFRKD